MEIIKLFMLFNVIPIQLSLLPTFLSKLLIVYWVMDLLVFSWYEMLALFSHGSLPRFSLPLAMGDWHQLCPLLPSSGYGRLASTVSPSPFLWLWETGINCVHKHSQRSITLTSEVSRWQFFQAWAMLAKMRLGWSNLPPCRLRNRVVNGS